MINIAKLVSDKLKEEQKLREEREKMEQEGKVSFKFSNDNPDNEFNTFYGDDFYLYTARLHRYPKGYWQFSNGLVLVGQYCEKEGIVISGANNYEEEICKWFCENDQDAVYVEFVTELRESGVLDEISNETRKRIKNLGMINGSYEEIYGEPYRG